MVEGKALPQAHKAHTWLKSGLNTGKLGRSVQPQRPECPECGNVKNWKDGLYYPPKNEPTQRHLCRECGYRFVEKKQNQRGILESRTLLTKSKLHTEQWAAGVTKPSLADMKGKMVEYIWRLKNNGYADCTVEGYARILKILAYRGADLWNPESVKHAIRKQPWSIGRKANAVHAYTHFTRMLGLTWEAPKYKPPEKLPFIPAEKEINDLIAGCSTKITAFLQLLKEAPIRMGEGFNLGWRDLDTVNNTVGVTPEKNSNPRIFKISKTLATMLNKLPKNSERIFDYSSKTSLRRTFEKQRKRIAHKLGNPRLLRIHFHTLRHWKATMEYRRTKDILYVMRLLGHKRIGNTLKYIQLAEVQGDNEEFICKVATTMKQASELIEIGYEYVCTTSQDEMLFRKRKL